MGDVFLPLNFQILKHAHTKNILFGCFSTLSALTGHRTIEGERVPCVKRHKEHVYHDNYQDNHHGDNDKLFGWPKSMKLVGLKNYQIGPPSARPAEHGISYG